MMLVKAGQAVDDFIDQVIPYLEQDIIIGLLYIGTGVSGTGVSRKKARAGVRRSCPVVTRMRGRT